LFGIVIAMDYDDHGPSHFHTRHADGAAIFGSTDSRSSTARLGAGGNVLDEARAVLTHRERSRCMWAPLVLMLGP
jgi:hypothetical protein